MSGGRPRGVRDVLEGDDVREILRDGFFTPKKPVERRSGQVVRDGQPVESAEDEGARISTIEPIEAPKRAGKAAAKESAEKGKPEHYKVICISLYNEDLERLDAIVKDLKRRGFTKASRSAVLRAAMEQFDPTKVTRGL